MRLVASLVILAAGAAATLGSLGVRHLAAEREAEAVEAHPPSGRFVDVDGITVHARIEGSGPDLVLLHGAGGSLRDFTFDLMPRLAERYRVIALDRPGHGFTDRAGEQYRGIWAKEGESPAVQARLLQRAADELDVDRPIVLGHSYGGAVAMAWGMERPDRTAALVVVSGVTMPWEGPLGWRYTVNAGRIGAATVVPLITAFATRGQADEVLQAIFSPQSVPDGYADHFGLTLSMRRKALRANARQVSSLKPHIVEMSQRYGELTLPVELIHGGEDGIVPASVHARRAVERLPNADLTVLEGIGHMPHHVRPEAVLDAVDRAARRAGLR